ncbi:MAG: hypothetical protein GY707_05370 [Desulfobacteraceae bacterium]|nr:hypothetical protein [Desulfobacteraceae bacterium]
MKALKQLNKWQLHTIANDATEIFKTKVYYQKEFNTDITTDNIYALTGNVLDDSTGYYKPGEHLRSNIITSIKEQKDKYGETRFIFETKASIYLVYGEQGDTHLKGGDWGKNVMKIFY